MEVSLSTQNALRRRLPPDFEDIEGYVFRGKSGWIAGLLSFEGDVGICQISFCPFCGDDLRGKEKHKCKE